MTLKGYSIGIKGFNRTPRFILFCANLGSSPSARALLYAKINRKSSGSTGNGRGLKRKNHKFDISRTMKKCRRMVYYSETGEIVVELLALALHILKKIIQRRERSILTW